MLVDVMLSCFIGKGGEGRSGHKMRSGTKCGTFKAKSQKEGEKLYLDDQTRSPMIETLAVRLQQVRRNEIRRSRSR